MQAKFAFLGFAQNLGQAVGDRLGEPALVVALAGRVVRMNSLSRVRSGGSLAIRAGISIYEASEIQARLRARFHRFEEYCRNVLDRAGLDLEISTCFGWYMQCPSGINPRTVKNFPFQSSGAEVLHVACLLAERRKVAIVAPVHDAIMAEGPLSEADDLSRALDELMGDAAAIVLRGYRLPTDCQVIKPGEHYNDARGAAMWNVVTRLLAKLQRETA